MKHELKISRLAVVCVLCAAVSGAYGASSVRSLGGSGTYTSAAAAAADGNSGGAASVRGGSLRVTPSSGVSGTTTNISAGNTTGGRVATSPRLSIGHYLGGGTSVSGGSSIRPITPGGSTSGGGSSSGGSGGVSSDDLDALRGQVDQLERDIEGLRTADDNFSDACNKFYIEEVAKVKDEIQKHKDFQYYSPKPPIRSANATTNENKTLAYFAPLRHELKQHFHHKENQQNLLLKYQRLFPATASQNFFSSGATSTDRHPRLLAKPLH